MATAYQIRLAQAAGDLDEDKLKKLGIAQLNSQLSNANSATAQATAAAVKQATNPTAAQAGIKGAAGVGATVAGAIPMANTPKLPVNPNTPEQKYLANYTGSAGASGTTATAQPTQQKDYLFFGRQDPGFKLGMSDEDRASWNAIGQKYAAGDTSWNRDTNSFREDGNWSGYYDDNGNYNGWLRAVNGVGGYAPAFGGKVGETGYQAGTVFYAPDGTVYTVGADGSLAKSGNATTVKYGSYIGPKSGYQDSEFWALNDNGQYQRYTNQTAPDSVLEAQGYYRDANGLVMPIGDEYYIAKALKNGIITQDQLVQYQQMKAQQDAQKSGKSTLPTGGYTPQEYIPQGGGTGGGGTYPSADTTPPGTTPNPYGKPVNTTYLDYLAQWDYGEAPQWTGGQDETWKDIAGYDYGTAPEWEGSEYENEQAEILKNAQNMQWTGSAHDQRGDELLEQSLQEYGGSQYDPMRDKYLEQYGEEWQGSPYQQERDDALKKAQNMQWNYDPNTDPVWQAYQKQYRREGDRASQEALAQAAMRTGGLANSYAVTAASQAGDYYAAQLSDWLPQLYQDASNRYIQEFERQMGISDQYAGFDQTEYDRWHDQQGRNLELADAYNQLGKQDYGRYQDRMNQLAGGADAYYQRGQTDYNRFLDEYDRQLGMADRYGLLGERDYGRYRDRLGQFNSDREFRHGVNRETIDDAERADQTAYQRYLDQLGQYNKDKAMSYEQYRDAIEDQRYDQQWAQQLREYADQQNWKAAEWQQYLREYGDQLSERERQWAYQQYRDAVEDNRWERQYADSRGDTAYERALRENELAYDREQDAYNRAWDEENRDYTRAWNEESRDYSRRNDEATQGIYNQAIQDYDYAQGSQSGGSSSPFTDSEIPNPDYKGTSASVGKSSGATGTKASTKSPTASDNTKSSGNYNKALSDVGAYKKTHTDMETLQYIKKLITDGVITDEEGNEMLWYFGYVTGSQGGGGGGRSVLMTK